MKVPESIKSLYQLVARPSQRIADEDERTRASTISSLLFLYLLLTGVSWAGVAFMLKPDVAASLNGIFLFAVPAFAAMYLLSRTTYVSAAAHLFVVVNIALIFIPAIRGPQEKMAEGLYHLTNSLIICSLILPLRSVIIVATVCLAGILVMPMVAPHVTVAFAAILTRFFGFSTILIIVITMIRERRLRQARDAERQARAAESRFRVLADHASEGVAVLRGDNSRLSALELAEANATFAHFFGTPCPEYGKRMLDSIFPKASHQSILHAIQTGESLEVTVGESGDLPRTLRVSVRPVTDLGGNASIMIVSDISAAREAVALRAEKLAAEAANRAKSIFLASVSHEIRTPLTAIVGFSELIHENPSHEKTGIYVDRILQNGIHLSQLINNVIDLSRIEAGQLIIDQSEFSPLAEIKWSMDQMGWKAEKRGIRLELLDTGKIPQEFTSDAIKFRQILFNLLDNAIKFSPKGSTITIAASAAARPGAENAVRLTVDVCDQGTGIPGPLRERIFNYFEHGLSAPENPQGSGIGLALSRRLAQELGGNLELVSSREGEGSTFRFSIVGTTNEAAGFPPDSSPEPAGESDSLAGFRILVVDDNPDNQLLSQTILQGAGAETAIAGNGRAAIDMGNQGRFDLILMDIRMPGLSGDRTAEILRENGYAGPIVALTADAIRTTATAGSYAGFDGFLVKPINTQTLLTELHKHLRPQA